ncbi:DUF4198 domain-containing protein [Hufsiella ginkgonis]|uniref:DUF4198 domain-containing protein n=1 Tax=Hufsiella ginkgonis TaxID=2695274 RepID=A0A7K1Y134_9SPHI|nr:DUF4198 domain-containing protein [Hufsiella ginkgonis]MXV16963.1 DUF4198 domain-containing protein [Hufsiella ginkgonis]
MKRILCCIMLLAITPVAFSQDYILLPGEFFLSKGQSLNVGLLISNKLENPKEDKYESAKVTKFTILEDGKKADLKAGAAEGAKPVLLRPMAYSGLALLAMERSPQAYDFEKTEFLEHLEQEGLSDLHKKAETMGQPEFREKYTSYMKALVMVDKASGGIYGEKLGQELEILLLQNPYKMKYGDDMIAQVLFQGKPLSKARVGVQTKGLNGSVFEANYTSDIEGKIYFKLNRSGKWVIRMIYLRPATTDKTADFESWRSSYSFGFKEGL